MGNLKGMKIIDNLQGLGKVKRSRFMENRRRRIVVKIVYEGK